MLRFSYKCLPTSNSHPNPLLSLFDFFHLFYTMETLSSICGKELGTPPRKILLERCKDLVAAHRVLIADTSVLGGPFEYYTRTSQMR